MPAPRVVATFKGHPVTAFDEGIPARDLTEQDWGRLSAEQRELVAASPRYDLRPKETKALAEQADQADGKDTPPQVGDVATPDVAPSVDPDQQAAPATSETSNTATDATATGTAGAKGKRA
jgi:hypothetical protein